MRWFHEVMLNADNWIPKHLSWFLALYSLPTSLDFFWTLSLPCGYVCTLWRSQVLAPGGAANILKRRHPFRRHIEFFPRQIEKCWRAKKRSPWPTVCYFFTLKSICYYFLFVTFSRNEKGTTFMKISSEEGPLPGQWTTPSSATGTGTIFSNALESRVQLRAFWFRAHWYTHRTPHDAVWMTPLRKRVPQRTEKFWINKRGLSDRIPSVEIPFSSKRASSLCLFLLFALRRSLVIGALILKEDFKETGAQVSSKDWRPGGWVGGH